MVKLENEPDVPVTKRRQLLVRLLEDVRAFEEHRAFGGPVERAEEVEQGALARSALAHNCYHLTRLYTKRNAAQHV